MNRNILKILLVLLCINSIEISAQVQEEAVSINSSDNPEATLDINGDLRVEHPDLLTEKGNSSFLYRDAKGQIVQGKDANERFVYTLELNITAFHNKTFGDDYIKKYDLKIPTDEYFVFVMGSTLYKSGTDKAAYIAHRNDDRTNPVKYVTTKGDAKTWYLEADYPRASLAENGWPATFYWKVKLLIINRNEIKYIPSGGTVYQQGVVNPFGAPNPLPTTVIERANLDTNTRTIKSGVGVNIEQPEVELDVNGNVIVRKTESKDVSKLTPLYLNKQQGSEGNLSILSTKLKPFTFLSGKIRCLGEGLPYSGDWIEEFNTKIPTDSYILLNTDVSLGNEYYDQHRYEGDGYGGPIMGIAHVPFPDGGSYNAQSVVEAFEKDSTWRLKADYPANPVCGKLGNYSRPRYRLSNVNECQDKYYWEFRSMALSRAFATDLGVYKDALADDRDTKDSPEGLQNGENFIQYLLRTLEQRKN